MQLQLLIEFIPQTYRRVTPSLAELGVRENLHKMNEHILMLTRVPDAGSELLVLILQRLQGYNAFKHIRLPPGDHGLLSTLQEVLVYLKFNYNCSRVNPFERNLSGAIIHCEK